MHEPDHVELFGKTPFKGNMPSMDVKPKDGADDWAPMKKADMEAVAHFLFLEGVEKGEPKQVDEAKRAAGEKIVKDSCTMCHLYKADGDLGGNGFAPELKGYGSFAWVRAQITNPASPATYRDKALEPTLKGHMPRFDEELPPADIELLARYVRAQARGLPFPPPKE
jgi:mono/diheme cytochrome c family protein